MAILDRKRGQVVVRIVYDGPAFAGKTTSLRTLSQALARPLHVPGGEAVGRTVFFDWVEYVGGRFEGYPVCCQLVSVPGQATLGHRRQRLLEEADAVVFVADTTADRMAETKDRLADLVRLLQARQAPPVGLVVQANKRDLAKAVELAELRTWVAQYRTGGLIESVATEGEGIRKAFVFAVRLALDRVRELMKEHALAEGSPEIETAEDLLIRLQAFEGSGGEPVEGPMNEQARNDLPVARTAEAVEGEDRPRIPSAEIASDMIWPPVEGRVVLSRLRPDELCPEQTDEGGWSVPSNEQWLLDSAPDHDFEDLQSGRHALLDWSRLHTSCCGLLSARRCLALAPAPDDRWRLWQVVGRQRTLEEELQRWRHVEWGSEAQVGRRLLDFVLWLHRAARRFREASAPLPFRADTVARGGPDPLYVGLMPTSRQVAQATGEAPSARELVNGILKPWLHSWLDDVPEIRRAVWSALERTSLDDEASVRALQHLSDVLS